MSDYMQEAERLISKICQLRAMQNDAFMTNRLADARRYQQKGREARAALLAHIERGPKLDKPARVGNGTFSMGIAWRLVVEAAQRHYQNEAERGPRTPEQAREDERKRRKGWEMFHGPLDADIERGRVPEGWKLVPDFVTEEMQEAFYGNTEVTRVGSILNFSAGYRAMLAAAPAAPFAQCLTCNGNGVIGGLLPNGGGYESHPCPDCAAPAAPDHSDEDSRIAALCDSQFAAGMLLGWNLATDGRQDEFNSIREERMRGACSQLKQVGIAAPDPSGWSQPEVRALATQGEMQRAMSAATAPARTIRLYAWRPNGHGSYSFFVAAESEDQARTAVQAEVDELIAAGLAYETYGWGTDYYEMECAEINEVLTNDNS